MKNLLVKFLAVTGASFPFFLGIKPASAQGLEARLLKGEAIKPKAKISRMIKQEKGIYNFSGTITDVLNGTPISDAELTFISPDQVEYSGIFTDGNGDYTTSINTYVDTNSDNVLNSVAITNAFPTPTAGRTGFYVNIPHNMNVSVNVYDVRGREVDDVLEEPMNGRIQRGQYLQTVNMRGKAAGMYFIRVVTDDGILESNKFIYVPGAQNEFIGIGNPPANPALWKRLRKADNQTPETWILRIRKEGSYYDRETPIYVNEGDNIINESMLPDSFDLEFFDECTGRKEVNGMYSGTTRWMQSPKLYIIDGPLEGYSHFQTPTQQEIDDVIATWKSFKDYTNGFINVTDDDIYIGHDINDEKFKEAVKQIVDGAVLANEGRDVSLWTDKVGSGDHGEYVEDAVIKAAVQRYRTGRAHKPIIDTEASQSIGFPIDPSDLKKRYDYGFTDLYKQCMKYNYSRTPNTVSPDRSTRAINKENNQ